MPTCFHCREEYEHGAGIDECCSHDCFYKWKGDKALNLLRNTHTHCATCGKTLKVIEEPPDGWEEQRRSWREHILDNGGEIISVDGELVVDITNLTSRRTSADNVVGFQYRTEDAEIVEKDFDGGKRVNPIVRTGTGCTCGQTDHTVVDKDLRDIELKEALTNYVQALWQFYDEGQLDQRLDYQLFFETYKESRDIEYALGVGLHQ